MIKVRNILIFIVQTMFIFMMLEATQRQSVLKVMNWIIEYPYAFTVNYLLLVILFTIFFFLFGRSDITFTLLSLLLFLFAFISSYKEKILGIPLLPWDFFMNKQAMNLISYFYEGFGTFNFVVLSLNIFAIIIVKKVIVNITISFKKRLIILIFAISTFAFAIINLNKMGLENKVWNQKENFSENGVIISFLMSSNNFLVKRPEEYSKENLHNILEEEPLNTVSENGIQPNVIIIMSEAFWDPTIIKGISFSKDPLPNFHRIQQVSTSGFMISPQFGGGTSNVEFEVLTGLSMDFLPSGSNAYQQYINTEIPSLASIYREKDYRTVAIHTYNKWFYNREKVYDYLGFERFIGSEDIINPEYKGPFISDTEITKSIIELDKNTVRPLFIHAVTMQNHGPYDQKRGQENTIKVSGDISNDSKGILENYTQGIFESDKEIGKLIEHFSKSDEPTILLFFGDHLPLLGSVYEDSGFVDRMNSWNSEEVVKMHSVPFFVWSNYNLEKMIPNQLSTSEIGLNLLNVSNADKHQYMTYIRDDIQKVLNGTFPQIIYNNKKPINKMKKEFIENKQEIYELIQYDILFGDQISIN